MNETVKILGCHFSYAKTPQHQKKYISKIENVLKVWRMRHLTLEGKIISYYFKSYTSYPSNYHFDRYFKPFEHGSKNISQEKLIFQKQTQNLA